MAIVTFSGGNESGGGFDMGYWQPSSLIGFLQTVHSTARSSTQVTYDAGGTTLIVRGTGFGNFDGNGDPQSGTVTSIEYTSDFPSGTPTTVNITGVSITIANIRTWVQTNNATAMDNAVLGAGDTFTGTAFADGIVGYGGNDTINAGDGADELNGGAGDDTLNGGNGNDEIDAVGSVQSLGNDTINGGDGNDRIGSFDVDTIDGGAGTDRLDLSVGGPGGISISTIGMNTDAGVTLANGTSIRNIETVQLFTGSGNDTLTLSLTEGATVTHFYGGGGSDTLIADFSASSADFNLIPSGQFNIGQFNGIQLDSVERYQITTGAGEDALRGGTGNDVFAAGGGNDELIARGGHDTLSGGAGNDHFTIETGATAAVDGGDGIDRLKLSVAANSTVDWNALLAGGASGGSTFVNIEAFDLGGTGVTIQFNGTIGGGGSLRGSIGPNVERIVGDFSSSNTALTVMGFSFAMGGVSIFVEEFELLSIIGSSVGDTIWGYEGNDNINGGGGDDYIRGDEGNDTLNGGAGNDIIYYTSALPWGVDDIDGGGDTDSLEVHVYNETAGLTITGAALANGLTLASGTTIRGMEGLGTSTLTQGNDTIDLAGAAFVGTQYDGQGGIDRLFADFSASASTVTLTSAPNESTVYINGIIFASFEELHITGSSSADDFSGTMNADFFNGSAGADVLRGALGDDTLQGGAGDDTLNGGVGADKLDGGDNNDTLVGGVGADQLNGGAGSDTADYSASAGAVRVNLAAGAGLDNDAQGDTYLNLENVIGTAFNDRFTGSAVANAFYGGAGNDTMLGQSGNDILDGGENDDLLIGGAGADQHLGGNGVDTADYSSATGAVRINLASLQGLDNHAQGDTFDSIEIVIGSNYADRFTGSANGDTFRAGAGVDALLGQNGDDILDGGAGADNLNGGNGNDYLIGGAGGDQIAGGTGTDTLDYSASAGGVRINISANVGLDNDAQGDTFNSVEVVIGSNFNDRFTGATQFGDDFRGGAGDDTLLGQAGNDLLFGQDGNDTLTGGANDDILNGGLGADALNGGAGLDTFVFADVLGAGNVDTITGFNVADDTINIRAEIFGVFGELAASAFTIGAAAADADDRIIYDSATGALYYDADGDGGGAAVQFATLGTGLALTNADFFGFWP